MLYNKKLYFCALSMLQIILCFTNASLASDKYPKTVEEKRMDKMDSVLDEGLIWRPRKIKNASTKAQISETANINKYLWRAAIEYLDFAPIVSADPSSGLIITDWYIDKTNKKLRNKVNIFIKSAIISADSIEIRLFCQKLHNGVWLDVSNEESSASLEETILRRARELYFADKK